MNMSNVFRRRSQVMSVGVSSNWLESSGVRGSPLLFRYSALTFNAHRIHYDHDYATRVEGYPGRVVQGPLIATLLMHMAQSMRPETELSEFEFRAMAPAFVDQPLHLFLLGQERCSLEVRNAGGGVVIKPSEFTSASTLALMELVEEAGFPAGVVNTVTGFGADVGQALVAHKDGAKCVMGGKPYEGAGATGGQFVEPTIFTEVNNKMRIAQEEVFGPILSVIPFDDEDDAVSIANDIRFGLAAGVWTQNMGRALRMSERLKAGTIWVNTYRVVSYTSPFGGYKQSGIGRESGLEAIKAYLQVKSIWIAHDPSVANPFVIR